MPPKKAKGADAASKKTDQKKKEKLIEDKTFGLKNKKGTKNQKFIQQVQNQVHNKSQAQIEKERAEAKKKKQDAFDELGDLNKLLKPVANMTKIGKDVDPKSVLCAFFKQGMCGKGAKCKFSHDLSIERKSEKKSLYVDAREDQEADTMDSWDDAKLAEVVNKKHKQMNTTEIICKYFLEAVENSKYGWFWECPNGGEKCIYKHALPPGYILKKDKKKMEELKEDAISLEELIEKERAALSSKNLTKVTLESFVAWKKKKIKEKKKAKVDAETKKKRDFASGKQTGLSGRDMFTFNPEMAMEDDDEADDVKYEAEIPEEEEGMVAVEIDENMFMQIDEDEDDDEGDENAATQSSAVANGGSQQPKQTPQPDNNPDKPGPSDGGVVFNEDLFDDDDIPDDLDDEDDDEGAAVANGIGNVKLKE